MGRSRKRAQRMPRAHHEAAGLTGTLRVVAGGAVVETDKGVFRCSQRGAREALPGDTVVISLHRAPGGHRRAQVERVLTHVHEDIVGTYDVLAPLGVVRPLDTRIAQDFFVLPSDTSAADAGVEAGDIVRARIVSYPARNESGVVTIAERLGAADAPDLGVRCVMARYDLVDGYPDEAVAQARAAALDVEEALSDPLRRDVRDRFVMTIDPVDARDFDDAISVERTREGWRLGVHIADVSHFVAWGSALDLEARARATSVYLADRVLPMLPEELSCDACSLVPGRDRLAFTVDIELDGRARPRSFALYPSVIRSRVRTDYAAASYLLGDAAAPADEATAARAAQAVADAERAGADLRAVLAQADAIAAARREVRRDRGAIDFETAEVHALVDERSEPVAIVNRVRTRATSLVEEAMLLANECVATWLADRGLDAAYRVHEEPSADHLAAAARVLLDAGAIGADEALAIECADARAIERVLERTRDTPVAPLVNALLLRAMQRAVYRPRNAGHYALAAPAYCHFTSPIRRYPDLLVHRAVKLQLARERLGAAQAGRRAPHLVGRGAESLHAMLPGLCRHASERERIADAAASATQKVMVARYYADRIGERLSGTVSWVDAMGAFVRVDETGAEGLVRMRDLGDDDWWELDEVHLRLVGERTGQTIAPGARVTVLVKSANPSRGHLDFSLVARAAALH